MKRLFIALMLLISALAFVTCERSDMYNMAMYGPAPKNAIYLYQIGLATGDTNGYNESNTSCYTMGLPYLSLVRADSVISFRGFSLTQDIRFQVPIKYWNYPVIGISPSLTFTKISNTWAGLWDGAVDNPINTALGMTLSPNWWSGSNADGSASYNCEEWHSSVNTQQGQAGAAGISDTTFTCDNSFYVVCLAY